MAISFVGKSAFAAGTGALSVGAVTGVVANDLILLFVESANQAITTPTGYTIVTGAQVSAGTAAAAGGMRLNVFYRWATGADTTTSVADSGDHTTAIKLVYRGVGPTTPFDATPVTGTKTTASTTATFPGITTTTADAWVIHASALDLDANSTATTGAATNANLTGITERHDQTTAAGVGGGIVLIDGRKTTAGPTGNTTATVTNTQQVYITMALRAAPDAQVLTPQRFDNAQTFYTHTVAAGPVALAPQRFDNAQTFFTPCVRRASDVEVQILKLLRNRQELDPVAGTFTVYDDDGVTPLWVANAWEDAAGTIPYSGKALNRIDRLEFL